MDPAADGSLEMGASTLDKVRVVATAAVVTVLLLGLGLALGLNLLFTLVLVALATFRLWMGVYVVIAGPSPALGSVGVRLRNGRADALVPWSEVLSLGMVPVSRLSRMYLEVMTSNSTKYPGPRKDGVNYIYLSPSVVTPQQVKDAVVRLTGGRLVVEDEPARRTVVPR